MEEFLKLFDGEQFCGIKFFATRSEVNSLLIEEGEYFQLSRTSGHLIKGQIQFIFSKGKLYMIVFDSLKEGISIPIKGFDGKKYNLQNWKIVEIKKKLLELNIEFNEHLIFSNSTLTLLTKNLVGFCFEDGILHKIEYGPPEGF